MKISQHFEARKRDNGETFYTLKDDAPEWLLSAVRDAHQGDAPDDWTWNECRAAADAIDDGILDELDDDDVHDHADTRTEIYTRKLFQWAADMCLSSTYANAEDEANDLVGDKATIEDRLRTIQYCAIRAIATTILQAYTAVTKEEE
jgi:hypothetical protein